MIALVLGALRALSPRAWLTVGAGIVVAFLVASIAAWVASKDHAVHRAEAQRSAAVAALARAQIDLVTARVNVRTLQTAIDRQNASIQALGAEQDATARRLEIAAQQARSASASANRRAAALLAGHAGPDPCRSGLEVARSLP